MKKFIALAVVATMSLSMFIGCTKSTDPKNETKTEDTKPNAKIMVNLEGTVTEIDGDKIKLDDQWVVIDDDTVFSDDPDNGSKPVSKDFQIGNFVQGYTEDSGDLVKALAINVNRPGKISAKVAVNISGEITEIKDDGKMIKVDGLWVIITDDTDFSDDPDNGRQPVSKDLKVGNRIAGFTMDDLEGATEVTAYAIYSNGAY